MAKAWLAFLSPTFAGSIAPESASIANSAIHPWNAIGRVNIAGFRTRQACTGTLVGPRQVVTAAHCLFDPRTDPNTPVHPNRVHFLAGYNRGAFAHHGQAACVRIALGYRFGRKKTLAGKQSDLAVIVLRKPAELRPLGIAPSDPAVGDTTLTLAGYAKHRSQVLTVRQGCKVQGSSSSLHLIGCDAAKGQSGGPVLIRQDGAWKVSAVISARNRKGQTIAVNIAGRSNLAEIDCSSDEPLQ